MTVKELKEIIRTYEVAIVNMENNRVSDRIIDKTRLKLSGLMKKLTLMKRKQAETVINMPGSEPEKCALFDLLIKAAEDSK